MNDSTKFFYSYTDLVKEINNFKIVDKVGINRYDSPAALYYKLVFYFTNDSGLLGLNDIYVDYNIDNIKEKIIASNLKKPFDYKSVDDASRRDTDNTDSVRYKNVTTALKNTAYNYLLLNAEYERAYMLKYFITLLSEINSSSPWYFQEITGLDAALERKMFSEGEFKLDDKPKQITIKCLHDAYDDRIGTLLDLYRAACFSYTEKKEVVPANLRKFNMGVLVFSAPIRGKGGKSGIKENRILIPDDNTDSNYYIPSAKLIELRNCEIDYNSSKSAWGTLNTTSDPFSPEYTITINFDDCYESRYNEIMGSVVTDFINADINLSPKVKTIDDNSALGNNITNEITGKQEVEKEYWVNSDYENGANNLYSKKLDYSSNTSNINIGFNVGAAADSSVLTTQLNNLSDKVKEITQLPSIKNNKIDNIHYNGTVNRYGEFEYLNRLVCMGGFVGNVMQQAVGTATSALKDKVSQVYLGNINSLSVSNMLDMGKRFLSGDIAGGVVSAKKYNNPQIGDKSMVGSKLPEYNGKDNTKQRDLVFKPTTKEIHDGGEIGRALNKGTVLDVDVLNHTLGTENETTETLFTTDEIWTEPKQRKIDTSKGEIWTDTTQRDLGFNPITNEIWTDPFQRNIDSDTIGELPGYIKNRTKFLNEMNTKQSIRNNI